MKSALGPVAALAALLLCAEARAATCESGRPTDPTGTSGGVSYGGAKLAQYDSASGLARVHYALGGIHAPPAASTMETGVPDAVVVAAQAADDALAKYQELGYLAPLGDADSPCSSNGDSAAIDIYLIHFTAADGQAVPEHCDDAVPKHCAGFVLVENDFLGGGYADALEGMRTVVPHELFHLVQDAYDADVERWWAEGSAEWAAKQVYPELQDLERFLPAYFKTPWRPFNSPPPGFISDFLYATAIWPVFLGQRYDAQLIREVYERLGEAGGNVLPATDDVLTARGSSLSSEFLTFAAYNAATGKRAPGAGGYADAARYPEVTLKALQAAPGILTQEVAGSLGAFYYGLSSDTPLELRLEGDPARVAAVLVPLDHDMLQLADAKPLPATLQGGGVVVVAGQSLSRTDAPFSIEGVDGSEPNGGAPSGNEPSSGPKDSGCSLAAQPESFGKNWALLLLAGMLARRRARGGIALLGKLT